MHFGTLKIMMTQQLRAEADLRVSSSRILDNKMEIEKNYEQTRSNENLPKVLVAQRDFGRGCHSEQNTSLADDKVEYLIMMINLFSFTITRSDGGW